MSTCNMYEANIKTKISEEIKKTSFRRVNCCFKCRNIEKINSSVISTSPVFNFMKNDRTAINDATINDNTSLCLKL